MWPKLCSRSESSSSSAEVDFLNLCKQNVHTIEELTKVGNLLSKRQCLDLSSKLSKTTQNIEAHMLHSGKSVAFFRPALENLYRYLEKAKLLVSKCGTKDWWVASVFQGQNENAFREILLEVGLCYNAIYEQASRWKDWSKDWNVHLVERLECSPRRSSGASEDCNVLPEDLRAQSSLFRPATDSDVREDQLDLKKRLEDLAKEPSKVKLFSHLTAKKVAWKQCLARYLLAKLNCTNSEQSQTNISDHGCSAILWVKDSEPSRTWGNCKLLGAGVCSTKWLGIPCAKKEFHGQETERFFMKEAGILAHLKHPRIVNFVCCGNGQGTGDRFIAMELMEKSLFKLIEEQKNAYFSVPAVVDMMVQMARGMCYLHDRGVAHRDLKSHNIVVNTLKYPYLEEVHFCMKLVDFGMSKTKVEHSKANTISHRGVGTTMYRAPEVHPDANLDGKGKVNWFKADVFSFAMTCAHILSLKTPFEDMQQFRMLYNELTTNDRRPEIPHGYPSELLTLIKDCWHTNPHKRPSFMEICIMLESLRHTMLRGLLDRNEDMMIKKMEFDTLEQWTSKTELETGMDFIKTKIEENSSLQRSSTDCTNTEVEGEFDMNEVVSIIPCTCGRALERRCTNQLLHTGFSRCNMCYEKVDEAVYHCESCQFYAHPDCTEIKHMVYVFFHDHPLHLLVRNYYHDNPDAVCPFCEESVQHSEWVYRCEQCDFDVHALCTKYPKERMMRSGAHPHLLKLTHCPPRNNLSYNCCNVDVKGYTWLYSCPLKFCGFKLHPFCAILPERPLCIFDKTHRLSHLCLQRGFNCSKCGTPGFSWPYHCEHCDVYLHLDCVNDIMEEEDEDWNEAYENLIEEYETKDDHTKMNMISELLDKFLGSNAVDATSSSSSRPGPGMMRVQPTVQRLKLMERHAGLDAFDDVNFHRKIAAEAVERKAKKMVAKEARQIWKEISFKSMHKNLEKIVLDLQNSKNLSQADGEVLVAIHKKLKKGKYIVQEERSMQVQSKMREGPRIGLFCKRIIDKKPIEILTSLQDDMDGVCLVLLCEEPGDEHVACPSGVVFNGVFEPDDLEIFQALITSGLQVVKRATMSTLAAQLIGLDPVDENVEALNTRSKGSSTGWLLSYLEDIGCGIFETFGLLRVRYRVTEERNRPRFTRGTLAWLCSDHQNRGIKAGTLEPYPLKYYNSEYARIFKSSDSADLS